MKNLITIAFFSTFASHAVANSAETCGVPTNGDRYIEFNDKVEIGDEGKVRNTFFRLNFVTDKSYLWTGTTCIPQTDLAGEFEFNGEKFYTIRVFGEFWEVEYQEGVASLYYNGKLIINNEQPVTYD